MADFGGGQNILQQLELQKGAFNSALQRYPILKELGLVPKHSPGAGRGNMLEFWPPGEPGSSDQPRPQDIPHNVPGVEIYSDKVRPIDVLGDVVSHHLVQTDPKIKQYYDKFKSSMTDDQQVMLQRQYQHAVQTEGEARPFDTWLETSGLPAYFRGYAFQQWPDEFNKQAYTPAQRTMFDEMMDHLSGAQKPQ